MNRSETAFVSVLSFPEAQLGAAEAGGPAGRSCSCNWHCCFKMKQDFSSLENIIGLIELLSIIWSEVVLTGRTRNLLSFDLSEALCTQPAARPRKIIRF